MRPIVADTRCASPQKAKPRLTMIGAAAREHQNALLAVLSEEERQRLTALPLRIAEHAGLRKGIHPDYSAMGPGRRESTIPVSVARPGMHESNIAFWPAVTGVKGKVRRGHSTDALNWAN
jgi:hypothetical protein